MKPTGKPDKPTNPDAAFARSYLVGCLVLIVAFLMLWAFVYFFWMR